MLRFAAKTFVAALAAGSAFVGVVWADSAIGTGRWSASTGDMLNSLGVKTAARATNTAEMNTYKWGGVIDRDGSAAAGDGGRARYAHNASACSIAGGDGGSQIPSGTGGCWIIDPSETIRPELFGARAGTNASTYDDGPRVLKAYNALCARTGNAGGTLKFGAGQYYFGSTELFMTACAAQFIGETPSEVPFASGTWFHINSTAKTPFLPNAVNSTTPIGIVAGFAFEHIGIYQDQPMPAGGLFPSPQPAQAAYTPTVYPPVFIFGTGGMARFNDIRAYPVYALMQMRNSGRMELGRMYTQCLSYCYDFDQTFDVVRLTGPIHNWDYWSQNVNVQRWAYANTDVFKIGRVDGFDGGQIFSINTRSLFTFTQGISGGSSDYASRWNLGGLYADATYQAIRSLASSAVTPQSYPMYLHADSLHVSCFSPGASGSTAGSAAIYVGPAGALDINIDNLTVTVCGGSTSDAAISLNNPNRPSTINVGAVDISYQGAIGGPFGPLVQSIGPNTEGAKSTVAFATPPQTKSNGNKLLNNRQFINLHVPQLPSFETKVGNSSTTATTWLFRDYALESSTSPNTGSTFTLPPNPWNGAKVTITGSHNFTGFTLNTSDGSSIAGAPTALSQYQPVTYVYRLNLNQWWPG